MNDHRVKYWLKSDTVVHEIGDFAGFGPPPCHFLPVFRHGHTRAIRHCHLYPNRHGPTRAIRHCHLYPNRHGHTKAVSFNQKTPGIYGSAPHSNGV